MIREKVYIDVESMQEIKESVKEVQKDNCYNNKEEDFNKRRRTGYTVRQHCSTNNTIQIWVYSETALQYKQHNSNHPG